MCEGDICSIYTCTLNTFKLSSNMEEFYCLFIDVAQNMYEIGHGEWFISHNDFYEVVLDFFFFK